MPWNWCFRRHGHQGEVLIVCFYYIFILLKDRRLPTGIKKTSQKKSKSIETLGKRKCHCWQVKSPNDQLSKHLNRKLECNEKVISVERGFIKQRIIATSSYLCFKISLCQQEMAACSPFLSVLKKAKYVNNEFHLAHAVKKICTRWSREKIAVENSKAPLSSQTC